LTNSKTSTSPHHGATGISSLQVLPDWEKVINDPARPDLALKTSPPPDEPFDIPNQRARLAEEEGMWSSRNPPSNWGYESKDETIPTRDGQGITAKIYWPQGSSRNSTTPLPLLFVAHGGGFIQGSPIIEEVFMIKTILENFKFVVVSVSFRLAPEWPFPTQLNVVEDALTWSVANAERLMIDEAKVYLAGSSAGAALTAVLAQVVRDKRNVEVSGVLLNGILYLSEGCVL
jgi:acetyl esterase